MTAMNDEQYRVLQRVQRRRSVMITGGAGVGKTFLLLEIVQELQRMRRKVAVTASTGLAASHLSGTTLHAALGLGLCDGTVAEVAAKARKRRDVGAWWRTLDVLVIDEVSMLDPHFFTCVDAALQEYRRNSKPFGGLQLVLSGDFLQLPPVKSHDFAFETDAWRRADIEVHELHEVHRQACPVFVALLRRMRRAELTPEDVALLQGHRVAVPENDIKPTRVFCRRRDVDTINDAELLALDADIVTFEATVSSCAKLTKHRRKLAKLADTFASQLPMRLELALCIGAQVMLTANDKGKDGLVNGSRGVVIGLDADGLPRVRFGNGVTKVVEPHTWSRKVDEGTISVVQVPLLLAWAVTVHKSQGMSLDAAEIDIGPNVFEYGQAYVALSRIRDLRGLCMNAFDPAVVRAHPKALAFYDSINDRQ